MRYEDASNSFQASGPQANDDSDQLPAGSKDAATGNLITGEGTQYGAAGADSAAGGHITSIAGKGGEDSSFAGGKLSVTGEYGRLTVDAEGNYNYKANANAPENVRDRFTYTLADNQGGSDTAALVIELGKTQVVIKADAQQIVPGPDGVVTLPPGVELSDVMVVGRNLVINMPDGTQLIIVDGAIFVPQLVLDGVSVPATNVAALLIGQEPQPAAGELPPSSGGNFALPPPPLDPGVPLGDLLPPTETNYIPPEPQELFPEEDSEPEVGPNPDVLLDDDALQAGNAGGVGDDADSVNATGQLSGSGGDGELTFAVQLTGAPDGFTYVSGGDGILLIQQGGVTVLTVTVDSDGSYSVVQNAPIDHTGANEDNVLFTVSYTVTDVDGDSAAGTFNINVDDDTPLLTELVAQGGVTLDESAAGSPAGFPISSNSALPIIDFNALFGADGAAAVDSTAIGLVINGSGASGIQTAVGDFPITLVQIDSDTIEGHYNGSNVAFIVQLEADGTITLTQNVPLEHLVDGPPGPAHDDSLNLGGLISVAVTITDGDGDEATGQVGIGNLLVFKDDGPSLGDGEVIASVDEDELPDGIGDGDSEDTTATGTLSGIVADFGADGPGSFGWDSSALGGLPNLTSNGAAVSYAIVGNMLVAYTGADASNAANHVFTVELEANGDYEVTLLAQVDHLPNSPANDDDQSLTIDLSGLVKITDSDGDFDHLNEGQFVVEIEDDIPAPAREVEPVTGQVDEDALTDGNNDSAAGDDPGGTTDSGGVGSLLTLFNIGADQPGKIVLLTDTSGLPELYSNGVLVTYAVVGDTLTASAGGNDVFTLTVNEDGSWDFELLDQLDHQVDDTEDNLLLDFSSIISAEDADGDTAAPLPNGSFVIDVDDDLPVPATEPNPVTGQVDEDALTDGNNDSADGDDPGGTTDSGGVGSLLTLFNIGADQPGKIVLLTDTSGLPELYSNGVLVTYAVVGDTLTASAGGNDVFTLTVNEDGSWDFELLDQLDHQVDDTEDNLLLDFSSIISAEDADGDTSDPLPNGSFVIDVDDDLPVAVDDTDTVGAPGSSATGNVITDNALGDQDDTDDGADSIGADLPGSITNVVSDNEPGNTDQDADPDVFEIQGEFGVLIMNADGSYTYTRDIGSPGGGQDVFTYTLTDADGDSVTAQLTIQIADAIPVAGSETATVDDDGLVGSPDGVLEDGNGDINANTGETPSTNSNEAIFNGTLNATGGDAPLTYSLVEPADGAAIGQETVNYTLVGDLLTATIATSPDGTRVGDTLFTVELVDPSTGDYVVTLVDNVLHGDDANNNEDGIEVQVTIPYQVEDSDGSTSAANGQLTISFNDDTPDVAAVLNTDADVELDETLPSSASTITLANGIVKGNDPDVPDAGGLAIGRAVSAESVLTLTTADYGADGPAANPDDAVYTLQVDNATSGLTTTEGDPITLVSQQNGTVVVGVVQGGDFDGQAAFAIQIDPETGIITVEQYLSLDHPVNNDPNDPLSMTAGHISAIVTIEDADGDTDTSSDVDISGLITFLDDGPTAVDADDITTGLENGGGSSQSALLDGGGNDIVSDNFGADGGKVIFTAASIAAMEAYGFENSGDPLTYAISDDGQTLYGFVDEGDGEFGAGDHEVLEIELQTGVDGNEYTVTMHDSVDTTVTFQFTDAAYDFVGGNDTWAGFALNDQVDGKAGDTPLNDDSKDLLLTPLGTGTAVNGNASSAGTTGPIAGQNIGDGEGMRVDYVSDLTGIPTPGDYNDVAERTHDFDNHYLVEAAVLSFDQGTSTETTVEFKALLVTDPADEAPGDDNVADPVTGTGSLVSIESVVISHGGDTGTLEFDAGDLEQSMVVDGNTYTVLWVLGGNGEYYVEVTGVYDDNVQMAFFGDVEYNALELLHLGPSDADADFAITGFGFATGTAADLDFSVPISVVDGDGDVVSSGDLNIHADAPEGAGFAATTLAATSESSTDSSSFSLLASDSQEEQLQKTAANSNTLTLATAVAAAGLSDKAAANSDHGNNGHNQNSDMANYAAREVVEHHSVSDDGDNAAVSLLAPEPSEALAPANTSSSNSSDSSSASNSVDDSAAHAAPESNDAPAADEGGSNSSAEAVGPVAPTVAMVSAEALQAAANDVGHAQKGGSVEQIVAEAMQHGGSDVDAVLANLPGGNGGLQAIAHMASPDVAAVSSWHTGGHGAFGAGFDMMFKMDVATHHQDAVQPVQNG